MKFNIIRVFGIFSYFLVGMFLEIGGIHYYNWEFYVILTLILMIEHSQIHGGKS